MTGPEEGRGNVWLPVVVAAAVLAAVAYVFRSAVTPLLLAALMAYLLNPIVNSGERHGLPRWATIMIIYVVFSTAVALVAVYASPLLVAQFQQVQTQFAAFWRTVPAFLTNVARWAHSHVPGAPTLLGEPEAFAQRVFAEAERWLTNTVRQAPELLTALLSNLVDILTFLVMVPFVAFFLLRDGREFRRALIRLLPNRYFETTLGVMGGIADSVGAYLRGLVLEAFIVSIVSVIGLLIVRLDYAVVVGIVAGIANMVPYLGPVIGALVGILVVLTSGSSSVFAVIVVFVVAHLIDGWIIQPIVMSRSVNLHPLLIFLAVVFGGSYGGLLGLVLAVPLVGAAVVTVRKLREGLQPPVYPMGLPEHPEF